MQMDDIEKTNAESVMLLHKYMHMDICNTLWLRVVNGAQVMTENVHHG